MKTNAVIFEAPQKIAVNELTLSALGDDDVLVDIEFSGVSTGTEKLLWDGSMPMFPGMGYPLVPGYEAVGRVAKAGANGSTLVGQRVFVPGAKCYGDVKGLFGGSASRVVVPSNRVAWLGAAESKLGESIAEQSVLMALAATAHHAVVVGAETKTYPELIVGHGVLGRLIARVMVAKGLPAPTVWEINSARMSGASGYGYEVVNPQDDPRRDYKHVCDVSGDIKILNTLMGRLSFGGVITLAGFYNAPLSFDFAPAFMREASIRIAAQWQPNDLDQVLSLVCSGALKLDTLITHHDKPANASQAYETAFSDPQCLKMIVDWRQG